MKTFKVVLADLYGEEFVKAHHCTLEKDSSLIFWEKTTKIYKRVKTIGKWWWKKEEIIENSHQDIGFVAIFAPDSWISVTIAPSHQSDQPPEASEPTKK